MLQISGIRMETYYKFTDNDYKIKPENSSRVELIDFNLKYGLTVSCDGLSAF